MKNFCLCICVYLFGCCSVVFAEVDPNNVTGITSYDAGTVQDTGACPSWFWVFERDGSDGGQITIDLDGCQIIHHEIFTRAQNAGAGYITDLEPDDLIIVWDEDANHGEQEQYKNFDFSGEYVADPDCDYIQITTTDSRTNWAIYRVTESGSLYKGAQSGVGNEHDAIRLQRNYLELEKTYYVNGDPNDTGCVVPGDQLTYEISWNNTSGLTFYDCYIVDYLDDEVGYDDWLISISPLVTDPNFNMEDNSYTWLIGDVGPGDSGVLSIITTVNDFAEPCMEIHNLVEMYEDPNYLIGRDSVDTPVCSYGTDPNIIYVDITATGNNTGTNWQNAYSGESALHSALYRARKGTCGPYTIYVAEGTYSPGQYASDTYRLPDGVQVYGGFVENGSTFDERNPDIYETILTGDAYINSEPNDVIPEYEFNDTVVTMGDESVFDPNFAPPTLLDGFTVTHAVQYGVYSDGVDFTIANCIVKDSVEDGVYALNNDVTINWSKIENNGELGIFHEGAGNTIAIENSHVISNAQHGIWTTNSTPTIKNCVIVGNGYYASGPFGTDYEAIKINVPTVVPVLYNNTILYNALEAIYWFDDADNSGDPNNLDYPDIQNCILWYNNDGSDQMTITHPPIPTEHERDDYAKYCAIQGCDDTKNNNIDEAPEFVKVFASYSTDSVLDPFYYHLEYDSVCKDKGNPSHTTTNVGTEDIDAEDRIYDSRADIGADEIYSCDGDLSEDDIVNRALDWNVDAIVNYFEFAEFGSVWLIRDPNDPGIITDPNFASDPDYASEETLAMWFEKWDTFYNLDPTGTSQYMIDVDDLNVIAADWLDMPCWKQSLLARFDNTTTAMAGGESMMMAPMAMSSMSMVFEPVPEPEPIAEPEPTTEELYFMADGIHELIDYMDTSIDQGHENADNLYDAMTFLEEVLAEMQADHEKKGL